MISFYLTGLKKLIDVGKKLVLMVIVFFAVISLFLYFINKDKPQIPDNLIKKNREEIYKVINDPNLNKTKEGKLTIAAYRIAVCGMIGEACTDNPDDGDKNFKKSIFGFISNLIVLPYANPPASGVYWAYNGLQNAGFIPKTYAAEGIGFAALRPFLNIWKIFRDIAYMVLVLVLIAIGFMIMFRMKINPQTVISVENALPKIIISLLLITFSFAIAGFMVDVMYFLIILTISLLSNRNNFYNANEFIDRYTNPGFGDLLLPWPKGGPPFLRLGSAIVDILPSEISLLLRLITAAFTSYVLVGWRPIAKVVEDTNDGLAKLSEGVDIEGSVVGTVGGDIQFPILGGLLKVSMSPFLHFVLVLLAFSLGLAALPLVIAILVLFTIVFLLFRIFFLLFTTYIRILIMIIFSPILLLFEAIPGRSIFSWWLKNLFGELLTFPLIIIILIVGYLIVNTPATRIVDLWRPPFLTNLQPDAFLMILGVGLILIIPDFVKMVKELLGAKGMPIGIGLGTFFSGVGALWAGTQGGLGMISSLGQAPFIGRFLMERFPKEYRAVFGPPISEQIVEAWKKIGPGGGGSGGGSGGG